MTPEAATLLVEASDGELELREGYVPRGLNRRPVAAVVGDEAALFGAIAQLLDEYGEAGRGFAAYALRRLRGDEMGLRRIWY